MTRFMLLLSVFTIAACGKNDEEESVFDFSTIPDSPLSGLVGGEAWDFESGVTDDFLSDADGFFAIFHATAVDCSGFNESGNSLITSLPTEPGEYEMGLSQTVTFYVEASQENLVSLTGGIRIDEVTETEIKGGLVAEFDADNEASGTFVIAICPDQTY